MTGIIEIEGGEVLANLEDRTITGRLIPFNEEGRTNVGRFTVEAGAVDLTDAIADPSIISLNLDHDRSRNVGRATRVWQQEDGVYCTWAIARIPDGDTALAEATDPTLTTGRKRLSGEFGPAVIRAGKLIAGHAKLWGSGLVPRGAFPGAMVLAADTTEAEPTTGHVEIQMSELPASITVTTDPPSGESAVYTPEAAPAEDNPEEGGSIVTATETEVLAGAQTPAAPIPAPFIPGAPVAQVMAREPSFRDVLQAILGVKNNPNDNEARQVLAALTDITTTGLPAGGSVLRPSWVGKLYQGATYVQEYLPLGTVGTDISLQGKQGFKVMRGTSGDPIAGPGAIPNGGNWAGNKAEINSYNGFTAALASILRRFAVGNDIAREFYDLPGGEEAIAEFLQLQVEDALYWADMWALQDINSAAPAPVAAATYPPIYTTNGTTALGMLIQGILAVKAKKADGRRDIPTFAILNDLAYAQLAYAAGGDQNLPAFVNLSISTNSEGTVDGNVQIVQGDTGITATPSVVVGAKRGIEFDQLPGGPVIINALDLAHGGVDRAIHSYLQTFVPRPDAFVRIGTADTFAQSTAYALGRVLVYSGTTYRVTTAGTTAASNPAPPAVGATVTSGTAVLTRLA